MTTNLIGSLMMEQLSAISPRRMFLCMPRYDELKGLSADEMYAFIPNSKDWLIKPMADAIELVQEGTVLVAILPAIKLNQSHGHVNTLTPGSADFSGRWDSKTPLCMNLGRAGTCFRAKGVNWAFQVVPEIYALVYTL